MPTSAPTAPPAAPAVAAPAPVPARPATRPGAPLEAMQRRTLRVLATAQLAGGAGLAAAATVGGLLAVELAGSDAVSGLPLAASIAGTSAAAVPLAALMRRRGRRPGLAVGWTVGAVGAAVVLLGVGMRSLALLLAGMALTGVGQAAGDASRYAAADLARPQRRGAAIGIVVFAMAVTATISPSFADASSALVTPWGLLALAGPFALALAAFAVAAVVLVVGLRPDPLLVARAAPGPDAHGGPASTGPSGSPPLARRARARTLLSRPGVGFALGATAAANFVMVFLMTPTPLHLTGHHHGLGVVGLATSAHLAGMYGPAPLTGRLADRWGRVPVIALGAAVLLTAGVVAVLAPPTAPVAIVAGVGLLGVGWNLAFVAGSTLLTDRVAPTERPAVQGLGDAIMGIAGIAGGVSSGLVFGLSGYAALGVVTAVVAAAVLVGASRRRVPVPAAA